jgi:hypothetical protein
VIKDSLSAASLRKNQTTKFHVFWKGEYPEKKRKFHDGEFASRQQARQFCRNHTWLTGLTIVHPDGKEERWLSTDDSSINRENP